VKYLDCEYLARCILDAVGMQWECSEREARNGWCMRHPGRRAVRMSYARDKPEGAFLVSGMMLVGCRSDVWRADGRSERQTDGEDQHGGRSL
jgi:hypothetical protein